jgi:tetratricopeptide (TPR) repeat protein
MKTPLALLFTFAAMSQACLWDSDTIASERARFPGVAEVMVGRFPRHSKEFYQWRLARVKAEIDKGAKEPALFDDLAVAQHKLGDHKAAIETMLAKEKISPGIYETYSNLGTFYIYTGDLDQALAFIDRALKINPNAHFGREKYQRWLVEWVKEGKPQTNAQKADDSKRDRGARDFTGFAAFIAAKTKYTGRPEDWKTGRIEALSGVGGMMRFADFDNPILLEALGDILMVGSMEENAVRLASLAYLHASKKSKTDAEQTRLLLKARPADPIPGAEADPWKAVKDSLDDALASGQSYANKIWTDERNWIAEGADAQREYEAKYLPRAR